MRGRRMSIVALLLLVAGLSALVVARGSDGDESTARGAKAAVALAQPPDTEAPDGAPPHWIPSEEWVMQHWLPYDEIRLLRLLGVDRTTVWRHLRDDRRTIGALADRRGWPDPRRLARALVAPRARGVVPALAKELENRALRTLTQGHLAQHILFHSLHQDAIPDRARDVFGVSSVDEFQRLRRSDLSPLQIARMNGQSRAEVQSRSLALLGDRARAGVRSGDMSRRQGALLLARQRRQVPRWLGEAHYNGPPRTDRTGRPLEPPKPAWANPALAASGREVVMEAYEPKLELALRRGEISVVGWSTNGSAGPVSHGRPSARRAPWSAYNPSVSDDGRRVAFETSAGNQNFAKRYGDTAIVFLDRRTGRTRVVSGRVGTAYAPALSADGEVVAFQATREGRSQRTRVYAGRVAAGEVRPIPQPALMAGVRAGADSYEPSVSADGRFVAYSSIADTRTGRSSQIFVFDRETNRTQLASRADGRRGGAADEESWSPRLTADGRRVAFASAAGNLGGGRPAPGQARVYLRDLRTGATRLISAGADGAPLPGFASEPAPSYDASVVAFSLAAPAALDAAAGARRPPQRVLARVVRGGETEVVAGEQGTYAGMPSISADGRRVAFVSDGGDGAGGSLQVYLRDRATRKTRLARAPTSVPANASGATSAEAPLCRLRPPAW